MRNLLVAATVAALALAGCSGDDHKKLGAVTCPDGTPLDPEALPGHHEAGFDALSHCPVPPSVHLKGVPSTLGAYRTARIEWSLDKGSLEHAHSMLTSVRYATSSVPDDKLAGPETFGAELVKKEHQDLPVTYEATLQFSQATTLYLRAYAVVEGVNRWSDESELRVLPVEPTGVEVEVTHGPGNAAGSYQAAQSTLQLGDAVVLVNDDVVEHTFTFTSGPAAPGPVTVAALERSEALPLLAPGTYRIETDDVGMPQALELQVVLP